MIKITQKYPSLKRANNVVVIALLALSILTSIYLITTLSVVETSGANSVFLVGISAIFSFVVVFGVYKKYSWAEIIAMIYTTSAVFGFILGLREFVLDFLTLKPLDVLNSIILLIQVFLSLLISVLLFKIRFDRSRKITEHFINYS